MVILLHGPDVWRRHQRLQQLRSAFHTKFDPDDRATLILDCSQVSMDQVIGKLRGGGLFTARRFVVVQDVWKLSAAAQDQLVQALDTIDADTIVIIDSETPTQKKNALWQRLLQADTIEAFPVLDQPQLRSFIQQTVSAAGATIEPAAVQLLIERIGHDTGQLSHQLHALCLYQSPITSATVKLFTDSAVVDNIFALTDALGNRHLPRLLTALNQQYAAGATDQYVVLMLARHIATLYKVKTGDPGGFGLHTFVQQKAVSQAARFSVEQLRDLHWRLLALDRAGKTSSIDIRTALTQMLTETVLQ
jgi:DNA polymerase-3 subunit delta